MLSCESSRAVVSATKRQLVGVPRWSHTTRTGSPVAARSRASRSIAAKKLRSPSPYNQPTRSTSARPQTSPIAWSPPSFDAHRETTYATIHAAAMFYSVLIRVPPDNPASTTEFVCDLCTEMPKPTDDGKTYTFKIRQDVKFHDGSKLTAQDVALNWQYIVKPPKGVTSARQTYYEMVDSVQATDDYTVVFKLKYATTAFLPALADPYTWIYKKEILEKDPHWFEKNIMGSGPFKLVKYEVGQSIKGERNKDYYHKGLPHLDGILGIFADKQSVRVDAIKADRASI